MVNKKLIQHELDKFNPVDPDVSAIYVTSPKPTYPGTNSSITLTQSDNIVASTKPLTKVINSVTYTRTLSYNAAGQFLSVSAWS